MKCLLDVIFSKIEREERMKQIHEANEIYIEQHLIIKSKEDEQTKGPYFEIGRDCTEFLSETDIKKIIRKQEQFNIVRRSTIK